MIQFKLVRWKNILSTGNVFTEIKLDKSPNTLIVGENGSGKSTILDALSFGLYGKPYRKIKKDQLINSINNRDAVVEVEFISYNRSYKIIRGIKPSVFEIYQDGMMINQPASVRDYQDILERTILRMNQKSFTQIVILGSSSFVPFMQLLPAIRREVIEDLLDIRIFSVMSSLLKDRIVAARNENILTEKDIQSTSDMINMQLTNQERINRDNRKLIQEASDHIDTIDRRIEKTENTIINDTSEVAEMLKHISDLETISKRIRDIEKIESGLESKRGNAKRSLDFYLDNDHCPTCTQAIGDNIKTEKVEEKTKVIESIEEAMAKLSDQLKQLSNRLMQIINTEKLINSRQNDIHALQNKVNMDMREISLLKQRICDLNVLSKDDELQSIIDDLKKKSITLNSRHEELFKLRETYEVASVILKDTGIKSRIIKQYVPVINALVNKYLAAMDFFVKFELNETFEEKILSRHRDDFTYDSFSEGEKMRIDLALLFTWRTIARMKNSASTNLLILDEVFDASLDMNGCEEFLKLIHTLEDANVFVISHKGDALQDKFRSSIKFEKIRNFSQVAR